MVGITKNVYRAVEETLYDIYRKPSVHRTELFDAVLNIVNRWKPIRVEGWDERRYRDDLYDMLIKERKSETKITDEDSRGGPDLLLARGGEKVAIELKLDLRTRGDTLRANQQFEVFVRDYSSLIAVLLGKTSRNAFEEARDKILGPKKLYPQKSIKLLVRPL